MLAVIIEDEKPAANRLSQLISRLAPEIVLVATLDSIRSAISWLEQNEPPQLIFLDIQLADGKSFEIFKSVNVDVPIIFTTAYDEYALQAFEHHCVDYLLKPINEAKLKRSLHKVHQLSSIGNEKILSVLESAASKDKQAKIFKKRFLIKGNNKLLSIRDDQIAFFHVINKIVLLVTFENRSFSIDQTIDELDQVLDERLFFRTSRSVIANIETIAHVEPDRHGKLLVETSSNLKQTFVVSRNRAKAFKDWLGA